VIVGVAGAGRSSGCMFGSKLQFAMIVGASGQTLLPLYVGLYLRMRGAAKVAESR